jgi:putative phosphoribosyl transferase
MTSVAGDGRETQAVSIPSDGVVLRGDLTLPAGARGLVLFAHGSGSSRLSSRNRMVARSLLDDGLGTLLFDLLTDREEASDARNRSLRFDIGFLAGRLLGATEWIASQPRARQVRLGSFGASTGAAAALVAAAVRPGLVQAIVSRGGRPDLAGPYLLEVTAPTLLIVGGGDETVLELNKLALDRLACRPRELVVVPGATHLFEEPGALEQVARLAGGWFSRYLV